MRKIWRSWKWARSSSSSSRALARSCPNGFSTTKRRNTPGGSSARPAPSSPAAIGANSARDRRQVEEAVPDFAGLLVRERLAQRREGRGIVGLADDVAVPRPELAQRLDGLRRIVGRFLDRLLDDALEVVVSHHGPGDTHDRQRARQLATRARATPVQGRACVPQGHPSPRRRRRRSRLLRRAGRRDRVHSTRRQPCGR